MVWFLNGPAAFFFVGIGVAFSGSLVADALGGDTRPNAAVSLADVREAFLALDGHAASARQGLSAMRGHKEKVDLVWSTCEDIADADFEFLQLVLDPAWPGHLRPYLNDLARSLSVEQAAASTCATERDEDRLSAALRRIDTAGVEEALVIVRAAIGLPLTDTNEAPRPSSPSTVLA